MSDEIIDSPDLSEGAPQLVLSSFKNVLVDLWEFDLFVSTYWLGPSRSVKI
jgi:hypothetical protein